MTLLRLVFERVVQFNIHIPAPSLLYSCIERVSSAFADVFPLAGSANAGCNLLLNFVKT